VTLGLPINKSTTAVISVSRLPVNWEWVLKP